MTPPASDFQQALDRISKQLNLDAADVKSQAAAAVTITLMLQQQTLPADLSAIAGRLAVLMSESTDLAVQVGRKGQCAWPCPAAAAAGRCRSLLPLAAAAATFTFFTPSVCPAEKCGGCLVRLSGGQRQRIAGSH